MARRIYPNPPIQEALCELRFAESPEWEGDPTLPGRLHDALRDEYPGSLQVQHTVIAHLRLEPQEPGSADPVRHTLDRYQFPSKDKTRLVAIGPGVLSVHVLRPYPGWEDFQERIQTAVQVYRSFFGEATVKRIGLRYINRICPPEETVELDTYFTVPPHIPASIGAAMTGIFSRIETAYQDVPIQMIVTFGTDAEAKTPTFILDVDMIRVFEEPSPLAQALEHIKELRSRERDAFEAMITDSARELFQ